MNQQRRPLRKPITADKLRRTSSTPLAQEVVFNLIERMPKSDMGRRVERILELLVKAEECREEIQTELRGDATDSQDIEGVDEADWRHEPLAGFPCFLPADWHSHLSIDDLNHQYREALREVQTLLIRYQWRPTVEDRLYFSLGQRLLWDRTSPEGAEENRAVQFLLQQIDGYDGPARILRFRRCRDCNRWLYALRDDQRHCGDSCRKRYASRSEDFKRKRAEYMRETYRPEEKKRNALSLERVKKDLIKTKGRK